MSREELIDSLYDVKNWHCNGDERLHTLVTEAIKALEQEPCKDTISRQAADEIKELMTDINGDTVYAVRMSDIRQLPPVNPQVKTGNCKECKYFEYDSVARVDGIPLIVAHEMCTRWGDGCKTSEDGYCFLFAPQESEGKE